MKRTILGVTLIALSLVALSTAAHAQEMSQEQMQAYMEYAVPGEMHALLDPYVGTWEETSRFWMAPDAEPMEMTSTSEAQWTLDRRWIRQEHQGEMMGQSFHGVGLLGYDSYDGEFISIWRDNMSTAPMITRGQYDEANNSITMTGVVDDYMAGRDDVSVRTVSYWRDADTAVYEMYVTDENGEEYKNMEVIGRRVTSADAANE